MFVLDKLVVSGNAVSTATNILRHEPLFLFGFALAICGVAFQNAFPTQQLQALAYAFVRLNNYGFDLYLVFFGLWCVLVGYLIFKATFMPRVLGLLLMVSGLGWLMYLAPRFAISIFPFIAAASAIGEIPLELWLLVKGVNPERWREQAGVAAL